MEETEGHKAAISFKDHACRDPRILRTFAFGLIVYSSMAPDIGYAQSSAVQVVTSVLDRHIEYCEPVMSDPQGFIESLPKRLPAGTYGTRTTPDGRLFRLIISSGNGMFTTHFSRYMFENRGHENCATYFTGLGAIAQDNATAAQAFETVVGGRIGRENMRGGQMPELYSGQAGASDILSENADSYEYLTRDVLSDANDLTTSHVTGDYVSFVTHRELFPEEQ
ncbi:MAG: hypothetical protein AAF641_16780 [Pseudomonadota bacterium]